MRKGISGTRSRTQSPTSQQQTGDRTNLTGRLENRFNLTDDKKS
ncbi:MULTISPECIES: hypothetical protein [unclassified Microcoleus]|nr:MULTISPECIES: hypothetical protein [unclassified Microcoleus]